MPKKETSDIQESLVKVTANYDCFAERLTLWGVDFVHDAELEQMVAEIPESQAAEMEAIGRVTIIK